MNDKNKKLGDQPAFPFEDILERLAGNPTRWANYKGISKRMYAALKLKVPDSGQEWLDLMIRKANRRDAALSAMQGLLANGTVTKGLAENKTLSDNERNQIIINQAYILADEMLKQDS